MKFVAASSARRALNPPHLIEDFVCFFRTGSDRDEQDGRYAAASGVLRQLICAIFVLENAAAPYRSERWLINSP